MKILSEDFNVLIDTKDTLKIDYDYVKHNIYAIVVKGQFQEFVAIAYHRSTEEAHQIMREIAQFETEGYGLYTIPKKGE